MATRTVNFVMKTGRFIQVPMEESVAVKVAEHHQQGGTFFASEKGVVVSVNMSGVLCMYLSANKEVPEFPEHKPAPGPAAHPGFIRPAAPAPRPPVERKEPSMTKALFKVECSCGADYYCTLFDDTNDCKCRECNERVFVDRYTAKKKNSFGQEATIVTNMYKVMQ